MNDSTLTCLDEQRRQKVRHHPLNGLDYVEVELFDDRGQPLPHPILSVHFLGKAPEKNIEPENVRIEGGRRILGRDLRIIGTEVQRQDDPELDDTLIINVDKSGDFSNYTLRLVALDQDGRQTERPFACFDQRYYQLQFSFKADCPSELDCRTESVCPPVKRDEPEINYLAKDYASFRQLILDRLALIMPDWQERHVPDLGIALVELLAYVGDYLSYYQDAVATEAYLNTARQRISVRRHVRLVDYPMHEGCNARAWVCVETNTDLPPLDPRDIFFITGHNDALTLSGSTLSSDALNNIPHSQYEVFEPIADQVIQFRLRDLIQPARLVAKLREARDELSKYLESQFSRETRKLLDSFDGSGPPPESLQLALLGELNRLLPSDSLYDKQRFAEVQLSEETQKLLQQKPRGESLVHLNRLLLEDAYPDELAKSEKLYLYAAHSEMHFYTWGDRECCLPQGATTATLCDKGVTVEPPQEPSKYPMLPAAGSPGHARKLHLQVGDVLIFEEVIGPKTGEPDDADPTHRHAVRLTKVTQAEDKLYDPPIPIVEIEWAAEDVLPLPFCISAVVAEQECKLICDISIARGNVMLVDHGETTDEPLGTVPTESAAMHCEGPGQPSEASVVSGRFNPRLKKGPLTFRQPLALGLPSVISVSQLLIQDPRQALPQVRLTSSDGTRWLAPRDLMSSTDQDPHFVAEADNDGRAHLRFGDGELGRMQAAGAEFGATYRVGNGLAGNVGAAAISHIVFRQSRLSDGITRVRNPMAARGGVDPEPLAEVKLFAPYAFRNDLQRAITADDYARLAERNAKVQRAAAALRWTGSWYEAQVAIDPLGTEEAGEALLSEISGYLYRYRRMGHDLVVQPAHYVPLEIELSVCVKPHYLRGHVGAALLDIFSNRALPDGRLGFFHPDNLSFGEGIDLSKLVAAAQAVEGVESVTVAKLQRKFEARNHEIANGVLPLGPAEIAQLDNDPSFPEHGTLALVMRGGR